MVLLASPDPTRRARQPFWRSARVCGAWLLCAALLAGAPVLTPTWAQDGTDAVVAKPKTEAETPQAAPAGPALWRVADDDSTLWIFGSIHALPQGLEWRRPEFDAAFAASTVAFFETSLDPSALVELQMLLVQIGMNPPGRPLSSLLSEEARARYPDVVRGIGLSPAILEPFQPWLASITVAAAALERHGASPTAGVDALLAQEASAAGKELRYFESGEFQMRLFADQPMETQVLMFEETIAQVDQVPELFDSMLAAWMSSDITELERVTMEMMASTPPDMLTQILGDRNRAWADELDTWMQGAGEGIVIVGAGHMIGPDNLIELLEMKGYVVERR